MLMVIIWLMMINDDLVPLKNDGVSWDDDI
jgi:hypothetical protein